MRYFVVVVTSLLLVSCASNTGTGVIAGGVLGASFGGIAGGGSGALIGSAAGIIAGGLVGAVLDEQDRKVMERSSPRTVDRMDRGEPLTINDTIKLSQGGVSDDTIMGYMRDTSSSYNLSRAQIRRLQEAGVSQRVINNMVDSGK
jgi:outer membrane lipoprotein SlyB